MNPKFMCDVRENMKEILMNAFKKQKKNSKRNNNYKRKMKKNKTKRH